MKLVREHINEGYKPISYLKFNVHFGRFGYTSHLKEFTEKFKEDNKIAARKFEKETGSKLDIDIDYYAENEIYVSIIIDTINTIEYENVLGKCHLMVNNHLKIFTFETRYKGKTGTIIGDLLSLYKNEIKNKN